MHPCTDTDVPTRRRTDAPTPTYQRVNVPTSRCADAPMYRHADADLSTSRRLDADIPTRQRTDTPTQTRVYACKKQFSRVKARTHAQTYERARIGHALSLHLKQRDKLAKRQNYVIEAEKEKRREQEFFLN